MASTACPRGAAASSPPGLVALAAAARSLHSPPNVARPAHDEGGLCGEPAFRGILEPGGGGGRTRPPSRACGDRKRRGPLPEKRLGAGPGASELRGTGRAGPGQLEGTVRQGSRSQPPARPPRARGLDAGLRAEPAGRRKHCFLEANRSPRSQERRGHRSPNPGGRTPSEPGIFRSSQTTCARPGPARRWMEWPARTVARSSNDHGRP
ncbi:hypothetical protein J1605_022190 [Eschrichtius robustus]|uniref:Uncharacterized protein n=1 Tax=Eschrichtius robustus TaxID=9764 RepID=A0AB34HER1_ESCRO|nr:hypothetical protein J1605_022190 [Eschrichtius robustus]